MEKGLGAFTFQLAHIYISGNLCTNTTDSLSLLSYVA
jgi:hypothetical protein